MDPISVKADRTYFAMMLRALAVGNYKIPRILDAFYGLSAAQQDAFVIWMHKKIGDDRLNGVSGDRMLYPEFVKAICMKYTGREICKEPTWQDLRKMVAEYCCSDEFKQAKTQSEDDEGMSFTEELEQC